VPLNVPTSPPDPTATTRVRSVLLLVVALSAIALLIGCGAPPEPLPTAPPRAPGGVSDSPGAGLPGSGLPGPGLPGPGGSAYPGAVVPTGLPPALPGGLPPVLPGVPGGGYPPAVTYSPPTVTTPPTTPAVPGAKKCTKGPTDEQLLATVRDRPGVPTGVQMKVGAGPYCAGGWQFATVELQSDDGERFDPLLVVTRGKPSALVLVEAGADVCSEKVQSDAPPGIRVRACGP
jgi:hypothetical protein